MNRLLIGVEHLVRDDSGQDLVEYGLLVALIAMAAIVVVGLFGTGATTLWAPIETFVQAV
jgi:Flp pilus assembly pilin Flp